MKVLIVYYSRTGNTEQLVNEIKVEFETRGVGVDVVKVKPLDEYYRPLHLNPRLIHDTLVRKGTDVVYEPVEPLVDEYDAVITASPIWYFTLSSPIMEFIKRHEFSKPLVLVTTSILRTSLDRLVKAIEELCGVRPVEALNITTSTLKNRDRLICIVKWLVDRVIGMKKE